MTFRRPNRFAALVERQLDFFAGDEAELFGELDAAERAYDAADRDDAEEAYSDFQLVLEATVDRLRELVAAYASTLAEDGAAEYEEVFLRAAGKRFPKLRHDL